MRRSFGQLPSQRYRQRCRKILPALRGFRATTMEKQCPFFLDHREKRALQDISGQRYRRRYRHALPDGIHSMLTGTDIFSTSAWAISFQEGISQTRDNELTK
jgi:hypothetical protein